MVLDKQLIRQMMKEKRLQMNDETLFLYSQSIRKKVMSHPRYQQAHTIGIYVSLPREVDTMTLIEETLKQHHVCVPKVHGNVMHFYEITSLEELEEGHFHVLEPTSNHLVQPEDIDLMIVPMMAFDHQFYRVGYGKGYYDRYFQRRFHGYKLGLAYSFQKVDDIDKNLYDIPLDEIINE